MKVLDVSFSAITPAWAEARLAEGWEALVQCCFIGGYLEPYRSRLRAVAESNLRVWREAGGKTAIYSNAAPWRTPQEWYAETRVCAGAEYDRLTGILVRLPDETTRLVHVMVDLEIADGDLAIEPDDVRTFLAIFEADGKVTGTYSGDWYVGWWKVWLGMQGRGDANLVMFGKPYWFARYDNVPDTEVNPPVHPLGPVVGKQYGGSPPDVDGVTVDFNVFNTAIRGDDMDATQAQQLEKVFRILTDEYDTPDGRKARWIDIMDRLARIERYERVFVRHEGLDEVYILTENQKLVHVVGMEVFLAQHPGEVEVLPPDSPVWNLDTNYPAGLPPKMRKP